MKKYYLFVGARQYGPFSRAELKNQAIHRDTPVWYEGLNEWVKAGTVDDLQGILPAACPPPFVVANYAAPQAGNSLPERKASLLQRRFRNRLTFFVSLLALGLLILAILFMAS